jgi:hypothetical protein
MTSNLFVSRFLTIIFCCFAGKYGNIGYYCEAIIERPGILNKNKKTSAAFSVSHPLNDADFRLNQPLAIESNLAVGIFRIGAKISLMVET